jgi:hypothetical protein
MVQDQNLEENHNSEVLTGPHINPINPTNDPNLFWMTYQDAVAQFACLNVCKAINMHEVRIKGKFLRLQDIENSEIEQTVSKWYYSVEVDHRTRLFVGLHQEDERKFRVLARKPYIDIGIAVLRRTGEGLQLIDLRDFQQTRQSELEITLEPGSYIILPRTTGCLMKPPSEKKSEAFNLIEKLRNTNKYEMHPLLVVTIEDIFNKFDMLMNGVLGFSEFKSFMEVVGQKLQENDFKHDILRRYQSIDKRGLAGEEGLTL